MSRTYSCTLREVGNSVALPLFSEALELEIVVMVSLGNITSVGGLDSMEDPVTGVIGTVPNISVNRFIGNRNNAKVGSVAVLLSVRGAFVEISGRFPCVGVGQEVEIWIIGTSQNRILLWLGNIGDTTDVTFSNVNCRIPDWWWW